MGIHGETFENLAHILVHERMRTDFMFKFSELFFSRKLSVNEQVSYFEEGRFFGKIFNRVTSVIENAFFSVEKCNGAFGRTGILVTWINRNIPCLVT
jgi:hypothetical protein